MPDLFKAEIPREGGLEIRRPPAHRCPPNRIPYVVDNLWEWKRPEGFPDRRFAMIASPRINLAADSAPLGAVIYSVDLMEGATVAQAEVPDSRRHPDTRTLEQKLCSVLDAPWFSKNAEDKMPIGRLFMPCLSREEVEEVFSEPELAPARDEIWKAIKFWDDVQLVDPDADDWPDDDGEIFFTAGSWRLEELS